MSMTIDGLSYWQAETEGIDLLDTTIGDLLDRRADEIPAIERIRFCNKKGIDHGRDGLPS